MTAPRHYTALCLELLVQSPKKSKGLVPGCLLSDLVVPVLFVILGKCFYPVVHGSCRRRRGSSRSALLNTLSRCPLLCSCWFACWRPPLLDDLDCELDGAVTLRLGWQEANDVSTSGWILDGGHEVVIVVSASYCMTSQDRPSLDDCGWVLGESIVEACGPVENHSVQDLELLRSITCPIHIHRKQQRNVLSI